MDPAFIRNFCIIAHIDHGKSTLADRLLELTMTVSSRDMKAQFLDQMDLERERGITIKGKAVRMSYKALSGEHYQLNLIDTPGHVDFSYEVSRSLAACEGALLLVDATQGIQAQTLANAYLALEEEVKVIPVINKIDADAAEIDRVSSELVHSLGFEKDEIILSSAKTGTGVDEIIEAIVERIPSPKGNSDDSLRALTFDSRYDSFKGVVAHVKVVDGRVSVGDKIIMMSSKSKAEVVEVGTFLPHQSTVPSLSAGEVGYVATGLKNVFESRVGDTITTDKPSKLGPLPGYRLIKPMVFAGIYPADGGSYESLRSGLEKLQLNDASLVYEPETSVALGVGFRCGFLGLLHMDIVQERLEREYGLDIVATSPGVGYRIVRKDGKEVEIDNPSKLPNSREIDRIMEPWLKLSIIAPSRFIGAIMELVKAKRGIYLKMEYITLVASGSDASSPANDARVLLEYKMPMGEALIDFYDQLQSSSHGYASLDYSFDGYEPGDLVKLDILINGKPIDALSAIVPKNKVQHEGKALVLHLRNLIPRQLFEVAIQAAVGSRIMVSESVRALRKNVLAKCYGGDITRKRKLLEKQAEGKKRLKRIGTVEVPQEAFLSLIKMKRDPS